MTGRIPADDLVQMLAKFVRRCQIDFPVYVHDVAIRTPLGPDPQNTVGLPASSHPPLSTQGCLRTAGGLF
jgi:hypothetical protein